MTIKLTRTRIALLAAALVTGIASVSYAAIPASNGTISACKDSKGALKVIDTEAGQACASNQQLLTWSQQGPAGPAGPEGAPGISGYQVVTAYNHGGVSGSWLVVDAPCPPGKRPIGGGGSIGSVTAQIAPVLNQPAGDSWRFSARELVPNANDAWYVRAYAICAYVG
jgi:hypothetical protein